MAGYLLSGIGAAALSLPFSLVITIIRVYSEAHDVPSIINSVALKWHWQWAIISFVTAATTAWLADNRANEWVATHWQPRIEGLVQGLMTTVATAVTLSMIVDSRVSAPQVTLGPVWFLIRVLTSFVLGFIIGFLVPNWYRRAASEPSVEGLPETKARAGSAFAS